jgi:hypothetical protein
MPTMPAPPSATLPTDIVWTDPQRHVQFETWLHSLQELIECIEGIEVSSTYGFHRI